jgi:D-aminoacyl-tRNA deacylase
MRALIQRVRWAEVEVEGKVVGKVVGEKGQGLLVYLGVAGTDRGSTAQRLAEKVANVRIFNDDAGKLNLSVQDVRGGVLVISNFTLLADARKGRRPTFEAAAAHDVAKSLYDVFVTTLVRVGCQVSAGVFGADMLVRSEADGPVNIVIDSSGSEAD